MSWFRIDDRFHSHPKVLGLPLDVLGLWVRAGSYGAAHPQLEGVLSVDVLTLFTGSRARARQLAAKLVAVRLWEEAGPDAWRFHDWNDWNPTNEEAEAYRSKRSAAGRIGGLRSGEARRSKNEASASKQNEANVAEATNPFLSSPVLSNPDPPVGPPPGDDQNPEWGLAGPELAEPKPTRRRRAESDAPAADAPPETLAAWLAEWSIPPDATDLHRFLDHHRARGSRFRDWSAAWRNWDSGRFVAQSRPRLVQQAPANAPSFWERKDHG